MKYNFIDNNLDWKESINNFGVGFILIYNDLFVKAHIGFG